LIDAFERPLLSWQGVQNLAFHVLHANGAAGLAACALGLVVAGPWLVLPWVALAGLARGRPWGWRAAMAASVVFLPTPLVPVAAYAIWVLRTPRLRAVFGSSR
jgi:hypothetical protein